MVSGVKIQVACVAVCISFIADVSSVVEACLMAVVSVAGHVASV